MIQHQAPRYKPRNNRLETPAERAAARGLRGRSQSVAATKKMPAPLAWPGSHEAGGGVTLVTRAGRTVSKRKWPERPSGRFVPRLLISAKSPRRRSRVVGSGGRLLTRSQRSARPGIRAEQWRQLRIRTCVGVSRRIYGPRGGVPACSRCHSDASRPGRTVQGCRTESSGSSPGTWCMTSSCDSSMSWVRRFGRAGASLTCERGLPTGNGSWPVEPQDVGGPSETSAYEYWSGRARAFGGRMWVGWRDRSTVRASVDP